MSSILSIVRKWKDRIGPEIRIRQREYVNILLFVDDANVIQDSQKKLQHSINNLHSIGEMYKLQISTKKTVVMVFKDKLMIIAKMIIDSNVLEQISHFSYLGSDVTYTLEKDLKNRLSKYEKIFGTLRKTLKY
jgi:hypothetical protein